MPINMGGFTVLALLYGVIPLLQGLVYISGLSTGPFSAALDPLQVFNFVSSIFSYHWLLANVLLSLKLPVLQRGLPYDLRIRFHVWSTLAVTVLLLWHGVYTIWINPQTIDLFSWIPLPLFIALLVLSMIWVPLPGLRKLVLDKAYDVLKSSHKVLFLAFALFSWWHVADRGMSILDPNNSHNAPPLSAWGYQLLFGVTVLAWLVSSIRERFLPVLTVLSATSQGGILRLNLSHHPSLTYRSGQFAFLKFLTPDLRREEHPFSFTSSPQDETVAFAIRELGDYTRRLRGLQPGDRVRINAGFGGFHPNLASVRASRKPLALIGSGIGVAPLVSLIKDLHRRDRDREVVLLQAVTNREELLEPEAIAQLAVSMPHLKVRTFVYEEDGILYSPEVLERELGQPRRFEVYLCSSERVRKLVVAALRKLGVPRRQVVFEAFSLG